MCPEIAELRPDQSPMSHLLLYLKGDIFLTLMTLTTFGLDFLSHVFYLSLSVFSSDRLFCVAVLNNVKADGAAQPRSAVLVQITEKCFKAEVGSTDEKFTNIQPVASMHVCLLRAAAGGEIGNSASLTADFSLCD